MQHGLAASNPIRKRKKSATASTSTSETPSASIIVVKRRPASNATAKKDHIQRNKFSFTPVLDDGSPIKCKNVGSILKLGSGSAGMAMESISMKSLSIDYQREFHCEKQKHCQRLLYKNDPPKILQDDVLTRDVSATPNVDVFFCTFPCQLFSPQGNGGGINDPRGICVFASLDYIFQKKPKIVLMENVDVILAAKHKEMLDTIRSRLLAYGYTLSEGTARLTDFHIPHNRCRWHLVGIRSPARELQWPMPLIGSRFPPITLDQIITPLPPSLWKAIPDDESDCCKTNLKRAFQKAVDNGINPFTTHVIVDVGASPKYAVSMHNVCPTITRTRASALGYWDSWKGGRLDTEEMSKLMGFRKADVETDKICTDRQFAACLGNGCSVTYLNLLIPEALYAANFISKKQLNVLRQRAEVHRLTLGL